MPLVIHLHLQQSRENKEKQRPEETYTAKPFLTTN